MGKDLVVGDRMTSRLLLACTVVGLASLFGAAPALTASATAHRLSVSSPHAQGGHYSVTTETGQSLVPASSRLANSCDDCTTVIALPFSFPFYGRHFTTARVSSNGNMQFGSFSWAYGNQCLPTDMMAGVIAPYWDDFRTDQGGGIYTAVVGEAPHRRFVLEWRDVAYWNGSELPRSRWCFRRPRASSRSSTATVSAAACRGPQAYSAMPPKRTSSRCNQPELLSGLAVTYTPTMPPPPPEPPPPPPPGVLYDQYDALSDRVFGSQNFAARDNAFDDELADHFVVPAGQGSTIEGIDLAGQYWNGDGPLDSVNVRVYENDDGDLPGGLVQERLTSWPPRRRRSPGGPRAEHRPGARHVLDIRAGEHGLRRGRAVGLDSARDAGAGRSRLAQSRQRLRERVHGVHAPDDCDFYDDAPDQVFRLRGESGPTPPPSPRLRHRLLAIDDSVGGDGDGSWDPGETVALDERIRNTGSGSATAVAGVLASTTGR